VPGVFTSQTQVYGEVPPLNETEIVVAWPESMEDDPTDGALKMSGGSTVTVLAAEVAVVNGVPNEESVAV